MGQGWLQILFLITDEKRQKATLYFVNLEGTEMSRNHNDCLEKKNRYSKFKISMSHNENNEYLFLLCILCFTEHNAVVSEITLWYQYMICLKGFP